MGRIVKEILGDKSDDWWKTPNPMFGNISPMWLVGVGASAERKVRNFIFDRGEEIRLAPNE
jgi:hypothetical protein